MLFAEDRHVLIFNRGLHKFFHRVPIFYEPFLGSAPNVEGCRAVLVVALDARTMALALSTDAAIEDLSNRLKLSFQLSLLLVSERDVWVPVHTYHMSPLVIFLINIFHQPLEIIAQEALDRLALQFGVIQQVLASLAVPFTHRHSIKEVPTIAALVGCSIAQVAQHD